MAEAHNAESLGKRTLIGELIDNPSILINSPEKAVESEEFEAIIFMSNPNWGLPGSIHDVLEKYGAGIVDFSHVDDESVTVYVRQ